MPEVPPLKSWIWTIAIAGCVYGALYISVMLDPAVNKDFDRKAAWMLQHEMAANDSALNIVAIGTSMTEAGIDKASFFSDMAEKRYGKKIHVYKIYGSGIALKEFTTYSQVCSLLVQYPPDILLIEENLLAYNMAPDLSRDYLIYEKLQSLYATGKDKFLGRHITKNEFDEPVNWVVTEPADTLHIDGYLEEAGKRPVRTFDDNKSLHPYLQQLQQKGTRIVLLGLPRPDPVEKKVHSGKQGVQFRQLLALYKQKFGMEYWSMDQAFSFHQFRDLGHVNEKGRALFSAWLLKKIVETN